MARREDAAASARRRHPDVEAYLTRQPLPARALVSQLRALVHDVAKDAHENVCYGVPFFFVSHIAICYVSPAKDHVTFGFTMGASIDDPTGSLVGTGKSAIRKVALALGAPVPDAARAWVTQAAALARSKPKAKP